MKVAYKTNIDVYRGAFTDHDTVSGVLPKEGMFRSVTNGLEKRFTDQKLPA